MYKRNILYQFGFNKKLNLFCAITLLGYALVALATRAGWIAANWQTEVGTSYQPPNSIQYFGTDILGRSVLAKVLHGIEIAMRVGITVALWAVAIGAILGIAAGYFGGIIDACVVWLYTVVTTIPAMILLMAVAIALGKGIKAMYIALIITEWTGTCRLVRNEVMRHKSREYMQAASTTGMSNTRKIFVHLLPNILPLIIYQFSFIFQVAIKQEVVLSYLGMGIQNKPSWGTMINDAKIGLLRGVWWELFFTTMAMFLLILTCNILADALRDQLHPKLQGR